MRVIPTVIYFDRISGKVEDLKDRLEEIVLDMEDLLDSKGYSCPECYTFSECAGYIGTQWALLIEDFSTNTADYLFESLKEFLAETLSGFEKFRINVEHLQLKGSIKEVDDRLLEFSQKELNNLKNLVESQWANLFETLIKQKFKIKKSKEKEIIDALIEGTPVPEDDPRHILHCYYEAYKQSEGEERPNYATTIYSLAFNTYNNNKKNKRKL